MKFNEKRLLASTDNIVGMKVAKRNNSDVTIHRKTTGHISRDKLSGMFICNMSISSHFSFLVKFT